MRKTKKAIASLAIAGMVLSMAPLSVFGATTDSNRLAGAGRVETAIAIAAEGWTAGSANVIVVPADDANIVDALAAAPLAGQLKAPILVTYKGALDPQVQAEIVKLGAKNVYAVGALSADTVASLKAISGVTVTALQGADRTETAAKVAAQLTGVKGSFVVAYDGKADALSAASFAAANDYSIVIANPDGTIPASETVVAPTYTVGGQVTVAGATALKGADRYATNDAVLNGLDFSYDKVYVANGQSLVDALAGAPLAAQTNSPIVLGDAVDVATGANDNLTSSSQVIALGGVGAVSDGVLAKVAYEAPATLEVESVSAINLNQIKVSFSQVVDEDTAELVTNYLVDGDELTDDSDVAVLQSDEKTVIITLATPMDQYQDVTLTVSENIYSEDLLDTVPEFEQEITFSDVVVPTVKAVTVKGNKQITVEFSEALDMSALDAADFELNGSNLVNYGFDDPIVLQDATDSGYTNKIKFNFNEPLPTGTNTITIPDGSANALEDGADFLVKETEMSFTVEDVAGMPKITSVTGETNGTVYVTYDRVMDGSTSADAGAKNIANYSIDGNDAITAAFKSGSGEKIVKLTFASGVVSDGANILKINADVEDVWGNAIEDDDDFVTKAFDATNDTDAPTVLSVKLIDDNVIRVKFSEKVEYAYARNTDNYTLKDSDGDEMTITGIESVPTTGVDSDTFDVTAEDNIGADCTLKIENIVDLAADSNEMDAYTATISGSDKAKPEIKTAIAVAGEENIVDVSFSEAMDVSSLTDKDNYAYAADTFKALPTGTKLEARNGNKTVRITFPAAYLVNATPVDANGDDKYDVTRIRVANVKDVAGNVLSGVSAIADIETVNTVDGIAMKAETFKLYKSGSTVVAEVQFDQTLSKLDLDDLLVAGQKADTGSLSGKTVLLKYTDTTKRNAIKAAGIGATVTTAVAIEGTQNSTGVKIAVDLVGQVVYNDQLAPELVSANIVVNAADQTVTVPFKEAVDSQISGLYKDDFKFINVDNGNTLTVDSVTVSGNDVIYTLEDASFIAGDEISVKPVADKISIQDVEDAYGDQNTYVPTADDKDGYKVDAVTVNFAAATAAVAAAELSDVQGDLDAAQVLVTALPAGATKTALQARITAEQTVITANAASTAAAAQLATATNAVAAAELNNAQGDLDAAQLLVTALPAGAAKDALQVRIDAEQDVIDANAAAAALAAAVAAVNTAADEAAMLTALQSATLNLDLDAYNVLGLVDKSEAIADMLDDADYVGVAGVQAGLDAAVAAALL